jgi:hypothetical protein
MSNRQQIVEDLTKLKESGYLVIPMNPPYQYRISGILDVYPANARYHFIKTNKRGSFLKLEDLVNKYLKKKRCALKRRVNY